MLDRILLKRTIAKLTGLTAISALVMFSFSPTAGAREPKPTVSSFTASADSPTEVLTASPLVLYNSGGPITLTADVSNATSCFFSTNRLVAGMPTTIPCANGPVTATGVTLPANSWQKGFEVQFSPESLRSRCNESHAADGNRDHSTHPASPRLHRDRQHLGFQHPGASRPQFPGDLWSWIHVHVDE